MKIEIEILKKIYNLENKDVEFGVIEDIYNGKQKFKPGLIIRSSKLYVDLLERRFFTKIKCEELTQAIYPAETMVEGDMMAFIAKEDEKKQVVLPNTILDDIYNVAWYDPSLEETVLL